MPDNERRSAVQAAVASVARGELPQIRFVGDELCFLDERIEKLEVGHSHPQDSGPDLSGIEPVEEIPDDAKAADIRDSVREMREKFNQLLEAFKNG